MIQKLLAIVIALLLVPLSAHALTMAELQPGVPGVDSAAVVMDMVTGEVLFQKNADKAHIPASLTKLVSALVVLDTNPKWNAACTVSAADEVGGARLATYRGAKYRLEGLLHASLVASANNATHTLARCTGLSMSEFVSRMNTKALQFGAINTRFFEPSGMDIANITTASDMAKIANAAYSTAKIREVSQKKTYILTSLSVPRRTHSLKNTNILLNDSSVTSLGGKTGYLDESLYNFAGSFKNPNNTYILTVLLGSPTKSGSFSHTKELVSFAKEKYAWGAPTSLTPGSNILGAITQ